MNTKAQLEITREFIADNLKECCIELVEFGNTGILKQGKLREAQKLLAFAGYSAFALGIDMVKCAAVNYVINGGVSCKPSV